MTQCILFNKQYVGKAETSFNIRLDNNQNDMKKAHAIMACKHFPQESHNFSKHAKFIIKDQLTNTYKCNLPKEKILDPKIRYTIPKRFEQGT